MYMSALSAEAMADTEAEMYGEEPPTPSRGAKPPPSPLYKPRSEESEWEVLATTATVEYFHTGNGADVLSSSPWTEATAAEEHVDAGEKRGDGLGGTIPLLVPPPEELSVSLYLEDDPNEIVAVVAVPRWHSDGEVWEVRVKPLLCLGWGLACS